jgi:DNA polymerase III sliding clamp (beta) subunit (PCNA family)
MSPIRKLLLEATQGHQLIQIEPEIEPVKNEFEFILPGPAINFIKSGGLTGEVIIKHDGTVIELSDGKNGLLAKCLSSTYPRTEHLIPQKYDTLLQVNTANLLNTVKNVAVLRDRGTNRIKLKAQEKSLLVSASNAYEGTAAKEVVKCECSDKYETIYNSKYLQTVLRQVETEDMIFELPEQGKQEPAVIRPVEPSIKQLYLLMPIVVDEV